MTIETGTHLGSYEVLAPIGAGGMGEVYQAQDSKLGPRRRPSSPIGRIRA
jgi:eukaryotic-like serine/threonine-protein kinase